ncbi:hypothetical protein [Cupriavidus sp. D39]|uniref:hypothetical protein n=1 Tax=Cupriavidus sp. D39 TaxID=2997877 RepID=UPI00226E47D4|nr:hypothetical protein [Cupriavidus sp. D39]MCY0853126.1 hypothetical protein [Cupriavidus sp. D39]
MSTDFAALVHPAVAGRVAHHGRKAGLPRRIAGVAGQEAQHGRRQAQVALILAPPDAGYGALQPLVWLRIDQYVQSLEFCRFAQRNGAGIGQVNTHGIVLRLRYGGRQPPCGWPG